MLNDPHYSEARDGYRSRFSYEPLRRTVDAGIRLLKVLPTRLDGCIQVQLSQGDSSAEYRCLSYRWGEPDDGHEILLDGFSFNVRENLLTFLELACQQFPNEPLWIDAICIDQSNDAEKADEVRRMHEIYTGAKEVLVWLGDETLSDAAIDWVCSEQTEDCTRPVVLQLTRLCGLEYWNRTWVTQEILLARKVNILIGMFAFEWTEFGPKAIVALGSGFHLHQLNFFWQRWTYTQNKHTDGSECSVDAHHSASLPFWDLFSWRNDTQCSDPRDRIYGLLALVRDSAERFTVDYTESIASLFWRAGTHFNAWALPSRTASLFKALSLDSQSVLDAAPKRIPLPIAYAGSPSASRIVYVRGSRAFLCQNSNCLGSIPFLSDPRRFIVLCMGAPPHEGEDPEVFIHGLIALTSSETGKNLEVTIFPPYFPRDYRHKERHVRLPQPALQVLVPCGGTARWLNVGQISEASQTTFIQDVNSKAYSFRLQVPSTFVTDYLGELFLYQKRMTELERSSQVRGGSASYTSQPKFTPAGDSHHPVQASRPVGVK